MTISNGLCWSPDGTVMYFADSPANTISAYRFDTGRGVPSAGRPFAHTPKRVHPDGSTGDAAGGVWNARWGAAQVVRYTAGGEVDRVIRVPASQPTCVAFGGADLDLLFVTTARAGLDSTELVVRPRGRGPVRLSHRLQGLTGRQASRRCLRGPAQKGQNFLARPRVNRRNSPPVPCLLPIA